MPFTTAAVALSGIVLATGFFGQINLIQLPAALIARIEQNEVDDIITMFVLIVAAFLADRGSAGRAARQAATLDAERLRVVQVTMRTVQDITNNCLNELQLLRFEAEGHVPPETLAIFDKGIQDTSAKLRALGDLEAYAERQMVIGIGLDPAPPTRAKS